MPRNQEALAYRYGEGLKVGGELGRTLSNSRQELVILGSLDEEFLSFEYDDDWYPETDGDGFNRVRTAAGCPSPGV